MQRAGTNGWIQRLNGLLCLVGSAGLGAVSAAGAAAQVASSEAAEAAAPGYLEAVHEAVGHYSAGRWMEAQRAFEQAHALQPSARTFRGLGLSAYYLGRHAAARMAFEQALAETRRPLPAAQRGEIETLLRTIVPMTARFELRLTPDTARVAVDGTAAPGRVLVLPRGQHALEVEAEGHEPKRLVLLVSGGEDRLIELVLDTTASSSEVGTLAAASQPSTPSAPATPSAEQARAAGIAPSAESVPAGTEGAERGGPVLAWIAAAAVPVFAGTAAAVWFTGESKHDSIEQQCRRDGCDEAEAQRRFTQEGLGAHETWTNVSLAAAGVALAASVLLFVMDAGDARASETRVVAQLPGGAVHGRF